VGTRAVRAAPLAAFVLHRYDWSESSLILDLFTREQGRIAAAAKGAKKPFSQLRSVLLPFQRIQVSLGRQPQEGEVREVDTLRGAEWSGGHGLLKGAALFSGFYLNELLMKLLARHDPHPLLFDAYAATVGVLARSDDEGGAQAALRAFEIVLLKEIGLLPDLAVETATRRPVGAEQRYLVLADAGVVEAKGAVESSTSGATLARLQSALDVGDLARLQAAAGASLAELRPLLRAQLHYHLGTSQLRTRQVMIDAQALDRTPAATAGPASR
jgi:DNA repair protein RecO (recombination protein O)